MSQQVPPWNVNFLLAVAVARLDAVAEEQESGLMQHTVHQRCFLARNFSSKSSPKEACAREEDVVCRPVWPGTICFRSVRRDVIGRSLRVVQRVVDWSAQYARHRRRRHGYTAVMTTAREVAQTCIIIIIIIIIIIGLRRAKAA